MEIKSVPKCIDIIPFRHYVKHHLREFNLSLNFRRIVFSIIHNFFFANNMIILLNLCQLNAKRFKLECIE